MREVSGLDELAPDYAAVLEELASLIQKVALRQAVAGYSAGESFPEQVLEALATRIPAEDLQLYYQLAILGRRDLELAPDARGGFEMVLLRMLAFRPAESVTTPVGGTRNAAGKSAKAVVTRAASAQSPPRVADWQAFIAALDVQGAARQLLCNCSLASHEGERLHLLLDRRGAHYRTPQTEETLAQALTRQLGVPVQLHIELVDTVMDTPARQSARAAEERVEAARVELENDATVRALKERFGATLLPDSIKPLS